MAEEGEYDWALALAKLYDDGFPDIPHVHEGHPRLSSLCRNEENNEGGCDPENEEGGSERLVE